MTNVSKLIIRKMAIDMVPAGTPDAFVAALNSLRNPVNYAQAAKEWVAAAILLVRAVPGCPWTTDEEIAGEILRRCEERDAALGLKP